LPPLVATNSKKAILFISVRAWFSLAPHDAPEAIASGRHANNHAHFRVSANIISAWTASANSLAARRREREMATFLTYARRDALCGVILLASLWLAAAAPISTPALKRPVILQVSNPAAFSREELVSVPLAEILQRLPIADPRMIRVKLLTAPAPLPTQIFSSVPGHSPDQLLVLVSIGARQTIQLVFFQSAVPLVQAPLVFGRAVPERKDDFAWENEKVAYRVYGPALQATGEITSGIDVWSKRVSKLIINDWYAKDAEGQRTKNPALTYHKDTGEGLDSYEVGPTRGCGGTAIWRGGKFYPSKNYAQVEILAAGPIRFQFRLRYAAWPADGLAVSEEKIISLDAGSHLNRIQSTFSFDGAPTVQVGVGLAVHPHAQVQEDLAAGILSVWEPLTDPAAGMDGTAIVLPLGTTAAAKTQPGDGSIHLLLAARPAAPIVYFAGAAWSRSDMPGEAAWRKYLRDFSAALRQPLKLTWN
jgi:Domain of unknown function (DUF4861)